MSEGWREPGEREVVLNGLASLEDSPLDIPDVHLEHLSYLLIGEPRDVSQKKRTLQALVESPDESQIAARTSLVSILGSRLLESIHTTSDSGS